MRIAAQALLGPAVLAGCKSEPAFYSHQAHAFVHVDEVPLRKELLGTWRAANGRELSFFGNGKFNAPRISGCWDVEGNRIVFLSGCINYGWTGEGLLFPLQEARQQCSFALADKLTVKDCPDAGEYQRASRTAAR